MEISNPKIPGNNKSRQSKLKPKSCRSPHIDHRSSSSNIWGGNATKAIALTQSEIVARIEKILSAFRPSRFNTHVAKQIYRELERLCAINFYRVDPDYDPEVDVGD